MAALKKEGRKIGERFYEFFPATEAAILFHLAFDHSPEDLIKGYLQGLFSFESFWGYLARLCTRNHNPVANIMAKHRLMLLSFVPELSEKGKAHDDLDLVARLKTHPRTNVRKLADLFTDKSGVHSAPPRTLGHVDSTSATFASRSKAVQISHTDQVKLKAAFISELNGAALDGAHWRPVTSLLIEGVVRVPESEKKLVSRTRSHYFQQRSTGKYGSILALYHISTLDRSAARARVFADDGVAVRSRLPLIRTNDYTEVLFECADVGALVVFATPRGKKNKSTQRVVLPNFRGYGGE